MKVLVLSNGQLEKREIVTELEDLQKIVGGYIEVPFLSEVFQENVIDVIINEEGKFIEGLRPEMAIVDKRNRAILDLVYGNCIFASHDDEGETIGLTEEQERVVEKELSTIVGLADKNTMKQFEARVLFI
jgi:hypothetical protein